MIARHRGEHHARGLWHPRRGGSDNAPAPPATDVAAAVARRAAREAVLELAGAAADVAATRASRRWRTLGRTALLLVLSWADFFGR
jgi:hypothetical protein